MAGSLGARAAEVKVLAGGGLTPAFKDIVPRFEQASGHKLSVQFAATPDLIRAATSGAPFDLGVVPGEVFKDASARARFAPDALANIARAGFGIAVRAGAAKPDIGTAASFKQTLLQAKSITLLPESAAGATVIRVFDRLGIADAMKAKMVAQTVPADIAAAVAKGEAELAVFLISVLLAPGVDLVGPFPGDLQQELVFQGALAADAGETAAARDFLAYLRSPAAAAIFKAKGLTPG